jgi:tetratricopeptide (TPR) repeat protein
MLPPRPALFGREAEAAALLAAVLDDDRRPLVVLGQAGIGKSALTLDMLHSTEVAARYGARRLFVRLDTATAASTIWTLILQALGSLPEADPQAQALALLAATPTLLVLDNAETPVQADMAGSVAVFGALAGVTSLQMLVSMRGQLPPPGIDWRRAINELQALPTDAAAALFRSIATGISADDPQLPDMLGLLGGLPLAITLMAHQAQGETRVQGLIADYRARRLRLSAGAGKQFDLAASIELSLASPRLDATARRLFAMAGRLPAGIAGADAAALVDGGTAAARALRQIGLAFGAGDRTLLLAPIREYAGGLALPAADEAALIEYYLALATEEGERIGNDGGAAALARLAPEIANLEASVAQAAALVADHAEGQAPLAAKAIAAAWGLAGLMRASGLGLPTTFDTLATMAGQAGDSFGEANCISSLGSIALARSDYPAAQAAFERALPLYQQADNKLGEVNCISSLGDVALARSDHAVARAAFTRALTLYQASEDTLGEANCIYSLGNIALERSEHAAAKAAYEQALQLYQQIDNKLGEAECIFRLGMLALEQPEPDLAAAEAAFERALPFYQEIGNTLGEANCILTLGNTALKRPDLAAARSAYERALPIYRLVGSKVGEGNCAFGLGDVVLAEGDSEAARRQWQAALALYRRIPDPYSIGEALRRLARVSEGAARAALVAEARAAWLSIDRPDLVTELDGEFGGG